MAPNENKPQNERLNGAVAIEIHWISIIMELRLLPRHAKFLLERRNL